VTRNPQASPQPSGREKCHFDVILAEGFVLIEVAAVVDAIRIANRVNGTEVFSWTYRSARGGPVGCRCGAAIETESFSPDARADYVFVVGNSDTNSPAFSTGGLVRNYTYRGAQVFLLAEAASRYLKEKGGEAGGLATHWENSVVLRERMELFDAGAAIASEDGPVVTCAGMGSTMDVVLAVIGRHVPSATLMTVANIFLHERIRDFSTRQPFEGTTGASTGDTDLDRAVKIMQAHIEDPVPIGDLVRELGISSRTLERKFRIYLGTTPKTYYRRLRLARANNLLLNTSMSVQEVGLATGFAGGLSLLYKQFYGVTPLQMRMRRRGGDKSDQG